jgi:hypothetical protein
MMKILVILASVCHVTWPLSPDQSDYESISMDSSKSLTRELLGLDLGYNVLNSEMLRKSIGASVDSVEYYEEDSIMGGGPEARPSASRLVRDRDFEVRSNAQHNVWSDEKFWGGPSPFFFPSFGLGPSRPAVRPFRRRQPAPKLFVGDQHQCATGSCEFFLFCWLGGGLIEGACGGFLFACCQRPDGGKASEAIAAKVSFFWTHCCFSHYYGLMSCPPFTKPKYILYLLTKTKTNRKKPPLPTQEKCVFCACHRSFVLQVWLT